MSVRLLVVLAVVVLCTAVVGAGSAQAVPEAWLVSASDYVSNSSGTWQDVPNMNLTRTFGANQVLIFFNARLMPTRWNGHGVYRIVIDGNPVGQSPYYLESYTVGGGAHDDYDNDGYYVDYPASTMWWVTLSSGQHTIKVQWWNEGVGNVYTKARRLMIMELK